MRLGTTVRKLVDGKKICSRCMIEKPISEFYPKNRGYKPDLSSSWNEVCKPCSSVLCRERRIRRKHLWKQGKREILNKASRWRSMIKMSYGLSEEEYYKIFNEQGGCCAICKKLRESLSDLHVDHDHVTGRVRGLLCGNCNRAIGTLKENVDTLLSAIEYLRK